jgi:hypothetical protein
MVLSEGTTSNALEIPLARKSYRPWPPYTGPNLARRGVDFQWLLVP